MAREHVRVGQNELDVRECTLNGRHAVQPAFARVTKAVQKDDGADGRIFGVHDDGISVMKSRHGVITSTGSFSGEDAANEGRSRSNGPEHWTEILDQFAALLQVFRPRFLRGFRSQMQFLVQPNPNLQKNAPKIKNSLKFNLVPRVLQSIFSGNLGFGWNYTQRILQQCPFSKQSVLRG